MKINLLELCLSPDRGGLELYVQKCSHELQNTFNVTTVIAKDSQLKSYLKNLKKYEFKRSIFNARLLAKIIDEEKIDILHLHWTKDLPIAVLAKLLSKQKPKIVQTRHMTMTRFKSDFYHKYLYKNIDAIICVTKAVEKQIIKFIPKSVRPQTKTIYLGVEEKPFMNQSEQNAFRDKIQADDKFIISIIGRINEFKGQHLLIEAMNLLHKKDLKIKAYIVGNPMKEEYLQGLKNQVKMLGLEKKIIFTGFSNEVEKYMQISDCVIMASKNETFGLVTVEAMMNKTAVIGANSGGVLEIIDDNKSGLLFQSGDAKDLSKKIEFLYNNENLKTTLAQNGYKKAHQVFNHKQQFDSLKNYMQNEVLNDRS